MLFKQCKTCKNYFYTENHSRSYCGDICREKVVEARKLKNYLRDRFIILAKSDFKCIYCGRGSPEVVLVIDHFIPKAEAYNVKVLNDRNAPDGYRLRSRIGDKYIAVKDRMDEVYSRENLVAACRECNSGKRDYLLEKHVKNKKKS